MGTKLTNEQVGMFAWHVTHLMAERGDTFWNSVERARFRGLSLFLDAHEQNAKEGDAIAEAASLLGGFVEYVIRTASTRDEAARAIAALSRSITNREPRRKRQPAEELGILECVLDFFHEHRELANPQELAKLAGTSTTEASAILADVSAITGVEVQDLRTGQGR